LMFCWHCGTRLIPGSDACPYCGYVVRPAEQEELSFEEVAPEFSWLGSAPARLERLLNTSRKRRAVQLVLKVTLAVVLVALSVSAWRVVVSGSWGSRLRGMNQILFVGAAGVSPSKGAQASGATPNTTFIPAVGQLYTIQPDGSNLHPLTTPGGMKFFSPGWSPDGAHIAAFAVTTNPGYIGTLVVMAADATNAHLVYQVASFLPASNGFGLFGPPSSRPISWSPDGGQLAATVTSGEFVVTRADGSDPREMTGFLPTWSADGHNLAYFRFEENHALVVDQLLEVAIWDTQASEPRILANLPMLNGRALAWSPNEQALAYSGQASDESSSKHYLPITGSVMLVRPDGTDAHPLVQWENGVVQQLVWSPDGKQLAVVVNRLIPASDGSGTIQATHTELWVLNSDGSNVRSLGPSGTDAPSWAPDGHHLVFASAANDWLEIADTTAQPVTVTKLDMPQMYVWEPDWSALPGLLGASS
jgi:Tol biopolymer transport system component